MLKTDDRKKSQNNLTYITSLCHISFSLINNIYDGNIPEGIGQIALNRLSNARIHLKLYEEKIFDSLSQLEKIDEKVKAAIGTVNADDTLFIKEIDLYIDLIKSLLELISISQTLDEASKNSDAHNIVNAFLLFETATKGICIDIKPLTHQIKNKALADETTKKANVIYEDTINEINKFYESCLEKL